MKRSNEYGRRLSRMSRTDRLLSRAIRRTDNLAKPKYQRVIIGGSDDDTYDTISQENRARGKLTSSKNLPKEWR